MLKLTRPIFLAPPNLEEKSFALLPYPGHRKIWPVWQPRLAIPLYVCSRSTIVSTSFQI